MFKLIYSNLIQRPTRTCVSILAVALGVVLILVTVGLSYGQLSDMVERTRRIGGDFMFEPSDASYFLALNAGTLPVAIKEVIERVDGVDAATPVLSKFISERFHLVFGIDKESFQRVNSSLKFLNGRIFQAPDEAIIDSVYARSRQLKVGDRLGLLGHEFSVVGIFEQGTAARVLLPLETLQTINGTPDKATVFFIRAQKDIPVDTLYQRLRGRFQHYKITKTSELQDIIASTTPVFRQFLAAVVVVSIVVSFLVILLAMYSTITERTREIGILKSLGASKAYIVRLILKESLLICAVGVSLGFLLTFVAIKLILTSFPSMPIAITPLWRVAAASMGIIGGTLGALYPAMKAARQDPVKALGYE